MCARRRAPRGGRGPQGPRAAAAQRRAPRQGLVAAFPELGEDAPTGEQWELLDKAVGLATMQDAIPQPMMQGIESVANQLVKDLAAGKADLSNLNIEAIGKQVLSNVAPNEVSDFANNLDKILPALQRLQPQ